MVLGETTTKSVKYKVTIDGKVVEHREGKEKVQIFDAAKLAKMINGNRHHAQVLATGLEAAVEQRLEIEPLWTGKDQELRLESVCIAGPGAGILR